jgi:KUP system potassium uptake protein
MLAALGIVFGDIGTSPLYAVRTVFETTADRPVPVSETAVFGVISVIFWTITLVVTVLYVQFLTRADNEGEGGLLALLSLLRNRDLSARMLKVLFTFGIFGAALFFGDSMITPAISVLSAMEGLEVIDSGLKDIVVPGAVAILVVLLLVQRRGTGQVGRLFGPIMAVWFCVLAVCGIPEIVRNPAILQALSPVWALRYFAADPIRAFLSLGGVVLVVTGTEALYADLGHFGRRPIARSWMGLVYPALVLEYLGQGALLIRDPGAAASPFFLLVPHALLVPMVVLATVATIIASQAVISGAFSVAHQAAQLGYLPHLRVVHTSSTASGQVYLPFVNWVLAAGVLGLVVTFQSSASLAAAYGLAVTGTMTASTALYFVLQWQRRQWQRWQVAAVGSVFVSLIVVFLLANAYKIPKGGWLPVTIGVVFFVALTTWHRGRELTDKSRDGVEGSLQEFVGSLRGDDSGVRRVPGCGVFLTRHDHALHDATVLLTLTTASVPRVSSEEQVSVSGLGLGDDGISQVKARLGYQDRPDLQDLLRRALAKGLQADEDDIENASFFFSTPELRVTDAAGMATWRKHLYVSMENLAPDPVEFFNVPRERAIAMGADVEI